MYTVLSKVYLEVAERFLESSSRSDYFSGSFEFESDGVLCRMVLSAVIYRHRERLPEGCHCSIIDNVVPVWWEFHTVDEGGERLNDFDFEEFKRIVIELAR